jgi:hypothetical protein
MFSLGTSPRDKINLANQKLYENGKAIAKIEKAWKNTEKTFIFNLVNDHFDKRYDMGGWGIHSFDDYNADILNCRGGEISRDAINVILTNNITASYNPLTAWILAHRMGHVLQLETIERRQQHAVGKAIECVLIGAINDTAIELSFGGNKAFYDIGFVSCIRFVDMGLRICLDMLTMRGAREASFTGGSECLPEMLAQYLITGRVRFNRNLKSFTMDHDEAKVYDIWEQAEKQINEKMAALMNMLVGFVLVW